MLDIMEFIRYLLQKIPHMTFIHFMSLKLIKTIQMCLILWSLLGILVNKVLIKSSKFILHSVCFLEIFRIHPKMLTISEFIR